MSAPGHRLPAVRCRAGPGGYRGRGRRNRCPRVLPARSVLRLGAATFPAMSEKGELDLTGAKQNTGMWLVKVRSHRRAPGAGPARPVAAGPALPSPPRRDRCGAGDQRVPRKRPGGSAGRDRA